MSDQPGSNNGDHEPPSKRQKRSGDGDGKKAAEMMIAFGGPMCDEATTPDDSPAHLPATCLAAVLGFMWYTDVRQCMLAGKMMAVESARHVETLNIVKASELDAPSARRFRNVSEVNVLCLVSEAHAEDNPDAWMQMCTDAAMRVVPFLSSIPNLERVFLGGQFGRRASNGEVVWHRMVYSAPGCAAQRDHQAVFEDLVQSIAGAFTSGTLSQSLDVSGILIGMC